MNGVSMEALMRLVWKIKDRMTEPATPRMWAMAIRSDMTGKPSRPSDVDRTEVAQVKRALQRAKRALQRAKRAGYVEELPEAPRKPRLTRKEVLEAIAAGNLEEVRYQRNPIGCRFRSVPFDLQTEMRKKISNGPRKNAQA